MKALWCSLMVVLILRQATGGIVRKPPAFAVPVYSNSYLPAAMQVIFHAVEQLKRLQLEEMLPLLQLTVEPSLTTQSMKHQQPQSTTPGGSSVISTATTVAVHSETTAVPKLSSTLPAVIETSSDGSSTTYDDLAEAAQQVETSTVITSTSPDHEESPEINEETAETNYATPETNYESPEPVQETQEPDQEVPEINEEDKNYSSTENFSSQPTQDENSSDDSASSQQSTSSIEATVSVQLTVEPSLTTQSMKHQQPQSTTPGGSSVISTATTVAVHSETTAVPKLSSTPEDPGKKEPTIDSVVDEIYEILKPTSSSLIEDSNFTDESKDTTGTSIEKMESIEDAEEETRFTLLGEKVAQVPRPSLNSYLRRAKVPPSPSIQKLANLYDALSKDARKQGFARFTGYSDEVLKDLRSSAEGGIGPQLKKLLKKVIERNELTRDDAKLKTEEALQDLDDTRSALNKDLRRLLPLRYTA